MTGKPLSRALTRRRVLLGATALAVNALAACGGVPVATDTPQPATTIAAAFDPVTAVTPSRAVPTVGRTLPATTSAPTTPLIVFAGASITASFGVQRTDAFPAKTIALLAPARYDAVDVAVSGETVRTWNTTASGVIDPLYAASRTTNLVVFYAGLNDLHAGASVEETTARIVTFGQARRRAGFRVVIGTLLPSTVHLASGNEYEAARQRVNASLRAQVARFADALADIGADPTIGVASAATNREYYLRDGIHPTGEGHSIIAAIVKRAILAL